MEFNRKQFFDSYRKAFGSIQQLQVDGLEFLLTRIEADAEWKSLPEIAYFLATIKHETGITRSGVNQSFQPIKELRAKAGSKGRANQDRYWLSGYYGRGYIQLTWKDNYAKFGLADVPDDALEPDNAYMIASRGMRRGMFTKFKLGDFINANEVDYHNARRVVNGLDKAELIAGYAQKFERILKSSLVIESIVDQIKESAQALETPKAGEVATQEPEPPAAQQAPKPEVTPVSPPGTSITTKVAAAASAAGPAIAATGLKIGGVEFKTGGLIAIAAIVVVGMIVAAYLWNESQKRRHEELKLSMINLASPDKQNVIAAGSKV